MSVSRLTGRVLVEFDEHKVDVEDLIAEVAGCSDATGRSWPSTPFT